VVKYPFYSTSFCLRCTLVWSHLCPYKWIGLGSKA
jgi:hypothetical protein